LEPFDLATAGRGVNDVVVHVVKLS
jgi:hypothetical protein